ncbi:exosome protein [Nitrosopumilus sp.]|nr:exosome protein [Nitrosopumilus sp.]
MVHKIEITIDVIVHSTEDTSKILKSFDEILEIEEEEFTSIETTGYFENPIIILSAKLQKKQGQNFIKKMLELLPINQINELIEEIEERTIDSRFHLRLDKQELVEGKLIISEKDTVKIKIHTPIYNKKDTVKIFTEIFQMVN